MNIKYHTEEIWIIEAINNILMSSLPKQKLLPITQHLVNEYKYENYHQKRHFRKTGKVFRRLNRIHQPGFDVQRRDHTRKRQ